VVLLLVATAVHQAWVGAFELGGLVGWPYLVQRVAFSALATAGVGTLFIAFMRRFAGATLGHVGFESGPAT